MELTPGQRWISSAEPELGLATVLRIDARSVQMLFARSGVLRQYARESAPFAPGRRLAPRAASQRRARLGCLHH